MELLKILQCNQTPDEAKTANINLYNLLNNNFQTTTNIKKMELTNVTAHKYQTPSIKNLIGALVKVQIDLSKIVIDKDQKKSYKDKDGKWQKIEYASLDNILKITRPILAAYGLVVTQGLAGELVDTCLNHESGEQIGYLTEFAPMSNKRNGALQNIGGGFTFLKRYTYNALLGICVEDEKNNEQEPQPKAEPLEPELLPSFPEDKIKDAALVYLKSGTLALVQKKYHVKEGILATIYTLAEALKKENETKAAEVDQEKEKPKAKAKAKAKTKAKAKAKV